MLVAPGNGGARVVALNRAAQQNGLTVGDLLSNARSKVVELQTRDADPAADSQDLAKLALWATRYTPIVAAWDEASGADGLFLDIQGCAHLFGGEEALLADLAMRLKQFGLAPRLAIADTAGASWAVARSSRCERTVVAIGAEREALCHLPVAALRLSPGARSLMPRLGLRRIADVIDQPRAPFAARFEEEFLQRLDQALGRCPEPLTPVLAPAVYRAQTTFIEPIMSQEHVLIAATRLLEQLCIDLADAEAGARVLRLLLFGVDGEVQSLELGLATASRDPRHIASLIGLRLDRLQLDSGFGFEAAALQVAVAEPLPAHQSALAMNEELVAPDGLACLVDRLQQRLGASAVYQLQPVESYIPERAERAVPVTFGKAKEQGLARDVVENVPSAPRPLLLLPRPEEAAEVTALIPDGPLRRFRWRGVLHHVTAAEGPERITPEWWQRTDAVERDYFRVQDTEGRRFWLYRDGFYGQGVETRWFVHGLFA